MDGNMDGVMMNTWFDDSIVVNDLTAGFEFDDMGWMVF